jgi:hypothetical protein
MMDNATDPNSLRHGGAMLDREDARARIVARHKAQRRPMYSNTGSGEVVEPAERAPAETPSAPASHAGPDPVDGAIDRERLRNIAERVQIGDTEEGMEALAELVEHARVNGSNALKRELRQEAFQTRIKAENDAALDKFAKKYPQLKSDHLLVDAATRVVGDEIAADLKRAGMADSDLGKMRGDVGMLATVHGQARARGLKLRSPDEILDAAGSTLTRKFNVRPASRDPRDYVRNLRAQRGFNSTRGAHFQE